MEPRPRVQFVSKPITEPFRDGTKCFVRDVANHLDAFEPHVLGVRAAEPELPRVTIHPVHSSAGTYAPGLRQNVEAALWMLAASRADLWHFVFAPNVRSSTVGRWLRRLRRIPVLQTVASPPSSFERTERLLFGDIVVAQSAHTRARLLAGFSGRTPPEVLEIPPPAPLLSGTGDARRSAARASLELPATTRFFLYPGDLETSRGAERTAALARRLSDEDVAFVFAYRNKTESARARARELEESLPPDRVRFVENATDIHALVEEAALVVFPVDDLYGKVDLPIVLLEAFRLGTPVVALDEGPLRSLIGARRLPWDEGEWSGFLRAFLREATLGTDAVDEARLALRDRYEPRIVAARYEELYRELLPRGARS